MARNDLFIEEIRWTERPEIEMTQSTHADVIVDTFVQLLRESFTNHPLYTYVSDDAQAPAGNPDYDLTQIVIVDRYTEDAFFLPIITTNINSTNTHWIQFSQSPFKTVLKPQFNLDGSIKRDSNGKMVPSHYEYVGAYDSSITLNISASDTIEREELANLLHVLLVEVLRDEFLLRGIHVKTVSVGGQTEQEYRNEFIYQVPVSIEIYSEWRRIIPVGETLKSIGMCMNLEDGEEIPIEEIDPNIAPAEKLEIYECETEFYVIDDASGDPVIPILQLSATDESAPTTLVFDSLSNRWKPSEFWKKALTQTLIPYENFEIDLNKESEVDTYLAHAGRSVLEAEKLRALSLSQGRDLGGGTKVIKGAFIFDDGRVQLKGGIEEAPLIYSTTVDGYDNSVEIRFIKKNMNKPVLVAKNIILNSDGTVASGKLYKRIWNRTLNVEEEVELFSTEDVFLDGENLNTMTAVDLFMIFQFAEQPFRYTRNRILEEIDKLIEELADISIVIPERTEKLTNIATIKQELIVRTEKYLIKQPVGL